MKARLLFGLKYLFFAFIAFTVPKMIVDSGRIVAPLEPSPTPAKSPTPQPRSFWPFRFLQAPPNAPNAPRSSDAFVSNAPAALDFADDGGRLNASRRSDAARFDGYRVDSAPDALFAPSDVDGRNDFNDAFPREDRSAFPRFAAPPFAPSSASTSFASDAALSSPSSSPAYPSHSFQTTRLSSSPLSASFSSSAYSASSPQRFEDLFRFVHSPAWFVENWPRVDAVATDDGLVGYRVALSTGNATDDLTGVFTCYFDATSERRVEFSGQTGDYRRLLDYLQREYGVALSPNSTAERFCYESTLSNGRGGRLPGRLLVRPNRVFLRGAEKSFFEVDVSLERPYNRYR